MKKILFAVGARPNFVKLAPLLAWYRERLPRGAARAGVAHTGQHYDEVMGAGLRCGGAGAAEYALAPGRGSPAARLGDIVRGFAEVCRRAAPDLVVVFGDVDSTLGCALAAKKCGLPVAHVEAGLRSGDRAMPEELNRLAVDAVADLFFTTSRGASARLVRGGAPAGSVCFAGNVMVDALKFGMRGVKPQRERDFALLTLHRPSNVDDRGDLARALAAAAAVSRRIKVLFPCHPRTEAAIRRFRLGRHFGRDFELLPPFSYRRMLEAYAGAKFVMTDSGCVQDETTALRLPCLTLRDNTERPETVSVGSNTLVGRGGPGLAEAADRILSGKYKKGRVPERWDGRAAGRIWRRLLA